MHFIRGYLFKHVYRIPSGHCSHARVRDPRLQHGKSKDVVDPIISPADGIPCKVHIRE